MFFRSAARSFGLDTSAPKHLHAGPKIVEIATYLSVIIFNEDFVGVLKVVTIMGCPFSCEAYTCVEKRVIKRASYALSGARVMPLNKKELIQELNNVL
ncbi:hypothetical protein TNCV_346391 [Trichonephila clavipes]|nr:hypothetical protein TNCV_346391 [Trichonephila clavipes]